MCGGFHAKFQVSRTNRKKRPPLFHPKLHLAIYATVCRTRDDSAIDLKAWCQYSSVPEKLSCCQCLRSPTVLLGVSTSLNNLWRRERDKAAISSSRRGPTLSQIHHSLSGDSRLTGSVSTSHCRSAGLYLSAPGSDWSPDKTDIITSNEVSCKPC